MLELRHFLIALQFLSTLPIHFENPPDHGVTGPSLPYYPLVGLVIGILLAVLARAGNGMPDNLHAAIVLAIWVILTGGLHLDGLADSADAWIGGLGDRQKTLDIMKDPCCGPSAVVTLVLILLIKVAALDYLLTTHEWASLLMAPLLGRTALVFLFLTTPYVRQNGLGSRIAQQLPRRACLFAILFTLAFFPLFVGINAAWFLIGAGSLFFVLRAFMLLRIGGTTGDTAGALVEITETFTLITAVLLG